MEGSRGYQHYTRRSSCPALLAPADLKASLQFEPPSPHAVRKQAGQQDWNRPGLLRNNSQKRVSLRRKLIASHRSKWHKNRSKSLPGAIIQELFAEDVEPTNAICDAGSSPPVSIPPSLEDIIEASPMIEMKPLPGMATGVGSLCSAKSPNRPVSTEPKSPKLSGGDTIHRTRIVIGSSHENLIIPSTDRQRHSDYNLYQVLETPKEEKSFVSTFGDASPVASPIYEAIDDTLERKLQNMSAENRVEANIIQVSVVESNLDDDSPPQVFPFYTLASSARGKSNHPHCQTVSTAPCSRSNSYGTADRWRSLTPNLGRRSVATEDIERVHRSLREVRRRARALPDSSAACKRSLSLNLQTCDVVKSATPSLMDRSPSCPSLPIRNPGMLQPGEAKRSPLVSGAASSVDSHCTNAEISVVNETSPPLEKRQFATTLEQIRSQRKDPLSRRTSESALQVLQAEYQRLVENYQPSPDEESSSPVKLRLRKSKSEHRHRLSKTRSLCDAGSGVTSFNFSLRSRQQKVYSSTNLLGSEFAYFPSRDVASESGNRDSANERSSMFSASAHGEKLLSLSEAFAKSSAPHINKSSFGGKPVSKGPMKKFVSFLKRSFSTSNLATPNLTKSHRRATDKAVEPKGHVLVRTNSISTVRSDPVISQHPESPYTSRSAIIYATRPEDICRQFDSMNLTDYSDSKSCRDTMRRCRERQSFKKRTTKGKSKKGKLSAPRKLPMFIL